MWHICWTRVVRTGFWWGNLRETGHSEELNIDEGVILKWIF